MKNLTIYVKKEAMIRLCFSTLRHQIENVTPISLSIPLAAQKLVCTNAPASSDLQGNIATQIASLKISEVSELSIYLQKIV